MFDEADLKGTSTGQKIWDRYTPNKDAGVALTDHLAQKSGGAGQIDTGVLAAATGTNAVVYKKIATFLNGVLTNMAGNSFAGSTVIHKNLEGKYPRDPREERYCEFGFKGLENTRLVYDRDAMVCWISTHYEAPKRILMDGQNPAAAMAHMEGWLIDNGWTVLAPAPAAPQPPPAQPAAVPPPGRQRGGQAPVRQQGGPKKKPAGQNQGQKPKTGQKPNQRVKQ
ncbi:MAG: hypothetical protein ACRD2W_01060 [Acidimicrobiales bacterium]